MALSGRVVGRSFHALQTSVGLSPQPSRHFSALWLRRCGTSQSLSDSDTRPLPTSHDGDSSPLSILGEVLERANPVAAQVVEVAICDDPCDALDRRDVETQCLDKAAACGLRRRQPQSVCGHFAGVPRAPQRRAARRRGESSHSWTSNPGRLQFQGRMTGLPSHRIATTVATVRKPRESDPRHHAARVLEMPGAADVGAGNRESG